MDLSLFNTNLMQTKFIKDILKDTYIPTVPIWSEGKPLIKDFIYVTKDYIVKAITDYIPENESSISVLDSKYFQILEPYIFGQFYPGITSNYESQSSMYDSETHLHLGNYLRCIRDLFGIDLLQFYNCWNNMFSDKVRISLSNFTRTIITNNLLKDGLRTILVPIKFFKKYTIYIDSAYPFQITPIYYDGVNVLPASEQLNRVFDSVNYCSFNQPYVFNGLYPKGSTISLNNPGNILLEKYLTLAIQLPISNSQNILVLEGDYSNIRLLNQTDPNGLYTYINSLRKIRIGTDIANLSQDFQNELFKSIPALTRNIGNKSYAFSDRLIEYLLLNVITKNDLITKDISRIQEYISSNKSLQNNKQRYTWKYISGIWDANMRFYIYDLVTQGITPQVIDINGYVDKDSESIIIRGK